MKRHVLVLMTLMMAAHVHRAAAQTIYTPYTFTTIAGLAGSAGSNDGVGSDARFNIAYDVAADSAGNVYVVDAGNYTIRKLTPLGTNWMVTTIAALPGSYLGDLAVDSSGNIYVPDNFDLTIRKVTPVGTNWVVTTIAGLPGSFGTNDGTGSNARFIHPVGMTVDSAGNLYVSDANAIRKVTPEGTNWVVTTIAGLPNSFGTNDGLGSDARFNAPESLTVDSVGNIYATDARTIRKVTYVGTNWMVTTIAGSQSSCGTNDGMGNEAQFGGSSTSSCIVPHDVAVDTNGNLYVADTGNQTIRKLMPVGTNWMVTTIAGLPGRDGINDGTGSAVGFFNPIGVAVDESGNVYVADRSNRTIRKGYPQNVPAVIITSPPSLGFNAGQFGFTLTGPTGQTVVVEASTDLVHWSSVWSNTFDGDLNFSDPQSGLSSQRFYRALTP